MSGYKGIPVDWKRMRPEFKLIPPCRDCGHVPDKYARFDDGSVQCIDRRACYQRTEVDFCAAVVKLRESK